MICHNFYYEKIDDLPKSWQLCKFGEIVNILRGASPRPIKEHLTTEAGGIPWIKIGDTKPGEIYINQAKQKIKKESVKKSVFLTKGSLILSNSMSFGRPYILNIDGCIHDGWLAIEIYNKTIDIEFLQYILQGYMWFFKSTAGGSSVDNLNIDKVKEMPFALPPYNEQKRIIASLRNIDAYINRIKKSKEEISRISAILKIRILEIFFGENSLYKSYYGKRIKTTLKELVPLNLIGDGDWVLSENMDSNGEFRLIQLKHISNGNYLDKPYQCVNKDFFEKQSCSEIKENYLLINRLVADSMSVCIVPKLPFRTITAVDVCWIAPSPNIYNQEYLMYYLMSPSFQSQLLLKCGGTTRKRISKNNLINITLHIHNIKYQEIIGKRIKDIFLILDNIVK